MRLASPDIIDQLYTPILVLDHQDRIVRINASFELLIGSDFPRLQGLPLSRLESLAAILVPLLERCRSDQRRCIARQQKLICGTTIVEADVVVSPWDQKMLIELATMDPMRGSRDSLERWQQAEAMELMIQGLCHEIRNPLAGMRGATQLLEQSLLSDPQHASLCEFTRLILQESERIDNMLESFFRRSQSADFQAHSIHQILDDVILLQASSWGDSPQVSKDYDPSLPDVWVEPGLITQVLLNLLRNAAQADAQHIRVKTRVAHAYPLPGRAACTVLVLSVLDDGCGVPAQLHDILFLPMVSGRPDGTGIGLAVSQQIARRHGGLLEYKNRRQGSEFRLILPLAMESSDGESPDGSQQIVTEHEAEEIKASCAVDGVEGCQ